ncbi:MAG: hypothetical protein WA991_04035 [Ornithinimicrobium sp.]
MEILGFILIVGAVAISMAVIWDVGRFVRQANEHKSHLKKVERIREREAAAALEINKLANETIRKIRSEGNQGWRNVI